MSAALLIGGFAFGSAASGAGGRATAKVGPVTTDMIFGSSGYVPTGQSLFVAPFQCELIGVGDFIPSGNCGGLVNVYQKTETPIAITNGVFTYFTVTTENPAPAVQPPTNRIIFTLRLCQVAAANCGGTLGFTTLHCTPAAGSNTCAVTGKVAFRQWVPKLGDKNPTVPDLGLVDVVASRGCNSTPKECPKGTYDPGSISWSAAYIK